MIAIDIYHGYIPPGPSEFLGHKPFLCANQGEIRLLNYLHLTDDLLANVTLLIVASLGHTSRITFSEEDAAAIERFVANGGNLLCAGQAWTWVYPSYGGQPEGAFPLNTLGKRFGFTITGQNIGGPILCATEITAHVEVITRRDWWPSEIKFSSGEYIPFMKDAQGCVMAAYKRHNKGYVVVLGHEAMLDANPALLLSVLKFLLPKWPLQQISARPDNESAVGSGGGTKP